MAQRIDNKVAVITGGASGIGEAMERRFCEEGDTALVSTRGCFEAYATEYS